MLMGSEGERFFGTPKQQAVGSTPAGFTNLTKIVHFTRGFDKNPRLKWTIFCVQRAQRNMRPIGTSKNGRFLLDDKEYIAKLSTIAMRNLQRPPPLCYETAGVSIGNRKGSIPVEQVAATVMK